MSRARVGGGENRLIDHIRADLFNFAFALATDGLSSSGLTISILRFDRECNESPIPISPLALASSLAYVCEHMLVNSKLFHFYFQGSVAMFMAFLSSILLQVIVLCVFFVLAPSACVYEAPWLFAWLCYRLISLLSVFIIIGFFLKKYGLGPIRGGAIAQDAGSPSSGVPENVLDRLELDALRSIIVVESVDGDVEGVSDDDSSTIPPPPPTPTFDSLQCEESKQDDDEHEQALVDAIVVTDSTCSICRCDLMDDVVCDLVDGVEAPQTNIMRLPCNHTFHGACARSWFSLHQTCPICRNNVVVALRQRESDAA